MQPAGGLDSRDENICHQVKDFHFAPEFSLNPPTYERSLDARFAAAAKVAAVPWKTLPHNHQTNWGRRFDSAASRLSFCSKLRHAKRFIRSSI